MSQVRGRPFQPGNRFGRGRPKGSRNKRSAQAQEILDQYTEPLIKKCVSKALEGDTRALGLCLERILPSLREPGVRIRMPRMEHVKDIDLAVKRLIDGIGNGNITPFEGEKIFSILGNIRNTIEGQEMEARITELEKHVRKGKEAAR